MHWRTLLRRNLRYHRRGNIAVILGIAVGTAVLVGALLVGDSLRGSLRERALKQLAGVHSAMVPGRFFSSQLAYGTYPDFVTEPMILLSGSIENQESGRRVGNVTVIGSNRRRWFTDAQTDWPIGTKFHSLVTRIFPWLDPGPNQSDILPAMPRVDSVQISESLADELGVTSGGQTLLIRAVNQSSIPRDSTLASKSLDNSSFTLDLKAMIVPDDDPLTAFNFRPSATRVRNVVIQQQTLRSRVGGKHYVNALLAGYSGVDFDARVRSLLTVADYGLEIVATRSNGRSAQFVSLQSKNLLLDETTNHAALAAASSLHLHAEPTLVHLANSISDGTHEIPYSVVAALNPQAAAPLGPFLDPKEPPLADDEILLADWAESPLTAKPGDKITLRYFLPESEGKATEATATFRLRAKVPMTGPAADPFLTPDFPGITDKLTLGEWDPPFPYDPKRITKRDEDYWNKYRATPKAYVNWAVGQKLFGSRFGVATSVRIAPRSPDTIEADAKAFETELKKHLNPADFGFVFRNVREEALKAAEGSVNFSGLFLGFSMFLIAAALLLVALLVRLNLERRASEVGLWLSLGFTHRAVRRLLLAEGLILSIVGAAIGLLLAVGYAALMLRLLAAMWPEGQIGSFLELHVTGTSLAIGFIAAVSMSVVTIWLAMRSLAKVPAPALLRGATQIDMGARSASKGETLPCLGFGLPIILSIICAVASLVAGLVLKNPEARAGAFFTTGAALLTVGLLALRRVLRSSANASQPDLSIARLGARNAARHPTRSLLTAGLLASAAFLLVAVESFRRTPAADFAQQSGGSGGFGLIGSMDVPLYQDPEDAQSGQQEILDALEKQYQKNPDTKAQKLTQAKELLAASRLIPLRVKSGDEAGCRNLYKPTTPRLFGVPNRLIERGGFHFASTLAKTPEQKSNPWLMLLDREGSDVPVFGEANTVKWMLGKSLGDTIEGTDGRGQPVKLRIVGLFQDSIFQGELVMAERRLLELYANTEGYPTLLAAAPNGRSEELRTLLETAYANRGIALERTADRLQSYLAIENTYLSTFQVLGGFGLLLGASGLGIVLMRSAWERRGELALLQAMGYRRRDVRRLVLSENLVLLAAGLGIGVFAALASVLPQQLFGEPASIPWTRLAGMLGAVAITGIVAGMLALRPTLRAPIVAALRGE